MNKEEELERVMFRIDEKMKEIQEMINEHGGDIDMLTVITTEKRRIVHMDKSIGNKLQYAIGAEAKKHPEIASVLHDALNIALQLAIRGNQPEAAKAGTVIQGPATAEA